jgi:hypothetical protein
MTLINMLFLGILPAGLLMWAGNVIRARGAGDKVGVRWLLFLLSGLGVLLITLIIVISISDYVFSLSAPVLLPITFGFTVALIVHLLFDKSIWSRGAMKLIPLFLFVLLLLTWITISSSWRIILPVLLVGILIALAWLVWDRMEKWHLPLFALEVLLLGFSIRLADLNRTSEMLPSWLEYIVSIGTYFIIPGLGIVMSALLIRKFLSNDQSLSWRAVISTVLMVSVLLLMIGYQSILISMWDVATDGLGWLFLWFITSIIGIGSAILMAWSIPRNRIWVAVLFALTVPLVMQEAQNLGTYDSNNNWGTTPIITTERRADRIEKAIQRYYERNNEYPQSLSDLVPLYILYIPNPFIIPGQDWCYQGGSNYYRFGYVYRKIFSTPAFVRIHSSVGESSNTNWGCQDEADSIPMPPGF